MRNLITQKKSCCIQFVKDYSEDYDTAILIAEKPTAIKPLSVDENYEIKRGEHIIAIGSPLGLKNTVSQGNFSGFVFEDPVQLLQFTAPISKGSSGGVLFNDEGNVIGITFASYIDGQNLNLAIPIIHALDLYENSKYIKKSLRDDFINYPRLTIQELNNSYTKYIDKPVIVEGYVSGEMSDVFNKTLFLSSSPDFDDDRSVILHLYVPFWIAELDVPVTKGQYITVAGEVRAETSEKETKFELILESIYCHNS